MRIKLGPIDGCQGTWSGVHQEYNGLAEEHNSINRVHKCDDTESESEKRLGDDTKAGPEFNKDECDKRKNGDGERGDTPEHLLDLEIKGEEIVPCCTMNATENEGKDRKEEELPETVILMFWTIERRNVGGVGWDESRVRVEHGQNGGHQKKGKQNDEKWQPNKPDLRYNFIKCYQQFRSRSLSLLVRICLSDEENTHSWHLSLFISFFICQPAREVHIQNRLRPKRFFPPQDPRD